MRNWEESGLPDEILDAIKAKNYKKPSPIQMQCIPLGLMNRDVVGIAQVIVYMAACIPLPYRCLSVAESRRGRHRPGLRLRWASS